MTWLLGKSVSKAFFKENWITITILPLFWSFLRVLSKSSSLRGFLSIMAESSEASEESCDGAEGSDLKRDDWWPDESIKAIYHCKNLVWDVRCLPWYVEAFADTLFRWLTSSWKAGRCCELEGDFEEMHPWWRDYIMREILEARKAFKMIEKWLRFMLLSSWEFQVSNEDATLKKRCHPYYFLWRLERSLDNDRLKQVS